MESTKKLTTNISFQGHIDLPDNDSIDSIQVKALIKKLDALGVKFEYGYVYYNTCSHFVHNTVVIKVEP